MSKKHTAHRALEVILARTDTGSEGEEEDDSKYEDDAKTKPEHNSESEDELDL